MNEVVDDIEQMKIAFPGGANCPYCGTYIESNNPLVRTLITFDGRVFCSSDHYEFYTWGRITNPRLSEGSRQ